MVRTIIISGGTSGIGLAAAKILSREGARTILLGRDTERGKKAEESVPGSLYVPCDVTKTDDCEKAVKAARTVGTVTGLVLSAGVYEEKLLENTTDEDIEKLFAVNVFGAMKLARASIPALREGKGAIVGVASDAAIEGNVQSLRRDKGSACFLHTIACTGTCGRKYPRQRCLPGRCRYAPSCKTACLLWRKPRGNGRMVSAFPHCKA